MIALLKSARNLFQERRLPYRLKHRLGFLGTLPDCLIIGAQKAGTTTLYLSLLDHPNVVGPDLREIDFFSYQYKKGLNWYRARFPASILRFYETQVRSAPFLTCESSPSYMLDPRAPGRARKHLPQVKIVALLRDPVERAYSHYRMMVRFGYEELSFAAATAAEEERIGEERDRLLTDPSFSQPLSQNFMTYSYLHGGLYVDRLEPWLQTFPREQVLVLQSEELWKDNGLYESVLVFLGLPKDEIDVYVNRYYGKGKQAPKPNDIDPVLKAELRAYFAPHNQRLVERLGQNFDWPSG